MSIFSTAISRVEPWVNFWVGLVPIKRLTLLSINRSDENGVKDDPFLSYLPLEGRYLQWSAHKLE